jgi:hypothetical protein
MSVVAAARAALTSFVDPETGTVSSGLQAVKAAADKYETTMIRVVPRKRARFIDAPKESACRID